jgi:protein-tyrosine phosphatase
MTIDPRRHLALEGSHNIRDLGGYDTADGRQTKWRRFLRAAGLGQLTAAAQSELVEAGLRTVVDLRRGSELEADPSVFAGSSQLAYHHIDFVGEGPIDPSQPLDDSRHENAAAYCIWLDDRQPSVRDTLTTLAAPEALPALFNCAAGKDRTGVTAALLLGLAGVPDATIVEDYALSARFLFDKHIDDLRAQGIAHDGFTWRDLQERFSPPRAMAQVLAHLHGHYGGIEAYVRSIGVSEEDISRLRAGLLE